MSEKKQCVNCNRGIDVAAKSCLYCNWWQAETPAERTQQAAAPASAPPQPASRRNRTILGAIAFVALLIIAFVIGSLIHGFEPSEAKAAQQPKTPVAAVQTQPAEQVTTNIPLVPDNSTTPPGPIDQTTTSASGVTTTVNGAMGSDSTAMTSQQFGATQQQPASQQPPASIDPRSVNGTVYGQEQPMPTMPRAPRPRRPAPTTMAHMTQPVPLSQPVPGLHGHGHAKLTLTVGTDGRVHDIDIVEPLAGEMGRLIGAVQSWRFRPATDNGVPVTSRFTVDINVE